MNRRQFLAAAPALSVAAAAQTDGLLRAGFSERDITPAVGMEQPGGYGKVFHKRFHDACKVRAAVFGEGGTRVALVGLDALVVPRSIVLAARAAIESECGIPGGHVLIGASHSHSSGPVGMVLPGEYDHASPLARRLAYEHSSMADARYLKTVEREIVSAVVAADTRLEPVQCAFGTGHEDKVAYNRRFRMKNGQSWSHPGQGNPDILEPAGPIDPIVSVVGTYDTAGRVKGVVVHYTCHATTNPDGISANWIHYLETTMRGMLGADVPVVFLQGFCGDVTQVDNRSPFARPNGEQWAKLVGGRVGAEAIKALLSAHPGPAGPIAARSKLLSVKRRLPSPERLRRSVAIASKDPKTVETTEWLFAKEIVMLDALAAKWPEVEAEVQTIQIGPAVWAAAPGEMFCQLGLDIRSGSPFPLTMPVELANGSAGYIPTKEAFGPVGGGYETRLTSYSNAEIEAGHRMVDAALDLIRGLKPGTVPQPPPFPAPTKPWTYGNVPPEVS